MAALTCAKVLLMVEPIAEDDSQRHDMAPGRLIELPPECMEFC